MEEITMPTNQENYFVLPDNLIKNRKYDYDIESNILKVSSNEKKGVEKEKETILVNRSGYKWLLFLNVILTIQFLYFIVYLTRVNYCPSNYRDAVKSNFKPRRLNEKYVTDFMKKNRKEITNSENYRKKNGITLEFANLIRPIYRNSLFSQRMILPRNNTKKLI